VLFEDKKQTLSHESFENTVLLKLLEFSFRMKVLKMPYCSIIGIVKHNTQYQCLKLNFLSLIFNGERQMASHESIKNTVPINWNVRTKHTQARLKLDSVKRYCEDL